MMMTITDCLAPGMILVCEEHTGIPGREGLALTITKVGKSYSVGRVLNDPSGRIGTGEPFRLGHPTTKKGTLIATAERVRYRIPKSPEWEVSYLINPDDSPCLCGSHNHEAEGITDCVAREEGRR